MDRESPESEPVTSVVGRLLQHIVALIEARADLTRQEMRAALRDVAIALFLLVSALALVLLMIPVAVAVLILVLAQVLPTWLATVTVLAVMLAVAAVLLLVARFRLRKRKRRLTFLTGLWEDLRIIWKSLERQR
jgi:undecaprenyl pyrophosphate phosphatase UppP